MNDVFLDTSYILALELASDQHHDVAKEHWQKMMPALPGLVTTSYILDEVVTFLSSRGYHDKAVSVGNMLLHSGSVSLVHVDEALFHAGWKYFEQHRDKTYSLTDCISFVVMNQMGLRVAFSIDKHFLQAGFVMQP